MIGAIVGAGLQAAGSIYGGIQAAKANRKLRANIRQQMDENQDWYDRNYNEDFTQRADAQRILSMTEDSIRKRNRAAAGAQAVMGGTEESVAAAKAANNAALADTASRIAAAGEQRKQQVEGQYMNRKEALQGQLNQMQAQKAQNIAQAVQGVGAAAGGIATALDATAKAVPQTSPVIMNAGNGKLSTDAIARQNQEATAKWLSGFANRYGIWDAK
jgi:hypothetical protein